MAICSTEGKACGQLRAEPRPKKTKRSVARNSASTALEKAMDRSSHMLRSLLWAGPGVSGAGSLQLSLSLPLSVCLSLRVSGEAGLGHL